MSYKDQLSHLEREGETSLTQQLVDLIAGAIPSGELAPGEKLPPTRELAELAGVNHLTAVRAYRRLRELGVVSSQVGRGTFVRGTGRPSGGRGRRLDRLAALRAAALRRDLRRPRARRDAPPVDQRGAGAALGRLSVRAPVPGRGDPGAAIDAGPARAARVRRCSTPTSRACRSSPSSSRSSRRTRGAPEDPDDILITNGAAQGLALACRAILRPGDVAACEDPSFTAVIRSMRDSGAEIVGVPSDDDGLDLDALEALLTRREIRLAGAAAAASQPHRARPLRRAARAPARARPPPRLLHPRGRDLLRPALRRRGAAVAALAGAGARRLRRLALEDLAGGLRVGWVAASGPVLDRIVAAKRSARHPQPDPHPAGRRPLPGGRRLSGPGRARPRVLRRGRSTAMREAIDRHLGLDRLLRRAARRRAPVAGLDLPLDERELADEAVRQGVAYVPGNALAARRGPGAAHAALLRVPGARADRRGAAAARGRDPRPARAAGPPARGPGLGAAQPGAAPRGA